MVKLNRIKNMLEEQRRELLDQLDAIDTAIAALDRTGTPDASAVDERPAEPDVSTEHSETAVLPVRVKSRRVMSDSQKHAVTVGKRRAREAKDAAKGLAREMPGDSFVPAIGKRGDRQPPRLVKRSIKK